MTFTLTNTGKVDGSETVQLYISQKNPSMLRPVKELKAFTKAFLKAGETKTCVIPLKISDMAFYNDKLSAWTLEADDYVISIASSSKSVESTNTIKVTH